MKNEALQVLKRKHSLMSTYYNDIQLWEKQRSALTSKINKGKARFAELISVETDSNQLDLFGNLDEYINGKTEKDESELED